MKTFRIFFPSSGQDAFQCPCPGLILHFHTVLSHSSSSFSSRHHHHLPLIRFIPVPSPVSALYSGSFWAKEQGHLAHLGLFLFFLNFLSHSLSHLLHFCLPVFLTHYYFFLTLSFFFVSQSVILSVFNSLHQPFFCLLSFSFSV